MLFSDRYWGIVVHGAFLKIDPQSIRSDIRERTLRLTACASPDGDNSCIITDSVNSRSVCTRLLDILNVICTAIIIYTITYIKNVIY